MTQVDSFGYLGEDFQEKLIAQMINDNKFGQNIIDLIQPKYFDNINYKSVVLHIKNYYDRYHNTIPSFPALIELVLSEESDDITRVVLKTLINKIKDKTNEDVLSTQDRALKFCKQQELKKAVNKITSILDKGQFDSYDECEAIIKKVADVGNKGSEPIEVLDNIAAVLSDDFRHPIPTGITGIDELIGGGLGKGELALFLAAMGVGKSLTLDSKIYTPNGFTLMGDIKVGDEILGRDGKTQYVTGVYPQGIRPIYEVIFNDGTKVKCDEEHLWSVNTASKRYKRTQTDNLIKLTPDYSFETLSLKTIKDNLKYGSQLNYMIPMVDPLSFTKQKLPFHPYLMGLMLGDGTMDRSSFVTVDDELVTFSREYFDGEVSINSRVKSGDNNNLKEICFKGVKEIFRELNLSDKRSDTKFIPEMYLYSSVEDRILLLQGMLDTDGFSDKRGVNTLSTASQIMANQVRDIVLSLGGFASIKIKQGKYKTKTNEIKYCKLSYIVSISFSDDSNIIPFKLTRKIDRFVFIKKYKKTKLIKEVNYIGEEEAQCITVSNEDKLFVTDDFIVTHNSTFLTKVANTASNKGYNVVQIVFEDSEKIIQRKHLACWSKINLYELNDRKEEALNKLSELPDDRGKLIIKRFSSDRTTVNDVKSFLRKLKSDGIAIDLVILDYIDCLTPAAASGDGQTANEGSVVRQLESMAVDFDIALWSAIQGNRSAINAEITEMDNMGGSIKRGQVAHLVISASKSLEQREAGTANIAILKSRFGKDGVTFKNCIFNNGTLEISTEESTFLTAMGLEQERRNSADNRIQEALDKIKNKK